MVFGNGYDRVAMVWYGNGIGWLSSVGRHRLVGHHWVGFGSVWQRDGMVTVCMGLYGLLWVVMFCLCSVMVRSTLYC